MLRTKSGLPKHCSWNTDHHDKRRVRFRKNGFTTYLSGTPWGEPFMRQHARALDGKKATDESVQAQTPAERGSARTIPGSINALVVRYYRSPDFKGLKPSTQIVRRRVIEHFRNAYGDLPVNRLTRQNVRDIIGAKADTPQAANGLLKVLRVLLGYAVTTELIEDNPAVGVKPYKASGGGFPIWTEPEIAQFEAGIPSARGHGWDSPCCSTRRSDAPTWPRWAGSNYARPQRVPPSRCGRRKPTNLWKSLSTPIWRACWQRRHARI